MRIHSILENLDRVKKSEPKKEFGKEKREYPKGMATFPKKHETKSTSEANFIPYKKSGTFGVKDDFKDVECYKCHKKGHYTKKCPEVKAKASKGPLKVRKM